MLDPNKERPIVCLSVATLQYNKKTVDCLMEMINKKVFDGWSIPEASLLPFARNNSIRAIYENQPDFTHVLFVDDDMAGFNENHIMKLVWDTENIKDCSIVSALVTFRKPPYTIVASFPSEDGPEGWRDTIERIKKREVAETTAVGMAFTVVKREVLDAVVEHTVDGDIWFTTDRSQRSTFPDETREFIESMERSDLPLHMKLEEAISFGQMAHYGTGLVGEDIAFCRRVMASGFKMFVDCGVSVGHIGDYQCDFRDTIKVALEKEKEDEKSKILVDV